MIVQRKENLHRRDSPRSQWNNWFSTINFDRIPSIKGNHFVIHIKVLLMALILLFFCRFCADKHAPKVPSYHQRAQVGLFEQLCARKQSDIKSNIKSRHFYSILITTRWTPRRLRRSRTEKKTTTTLQWSRATAVRSFNLNAHKWYTERCHFGIELCE